MKDEQVEQIEDFRRKLENIFNTNQTLFHPADIKRIQEDANYCHRFLRASKNRVELAVEIARKALEWRKSMGVNDMCESTAKCTDYLASKSLYPYGVTKTGAHILVMKTRNHTKPKNAEESLEHKKLFAFMLEQMISERHTKRICLMMDCQGAGYSNVDMEGMKFMITAFRDYYPALLEQILVVDMPWVFQTVWKVIKGLLPSEAHKIVHFVDKKQLVEFIDKDNLPTSLNGTNDYSYSYVPGNPLGEFCPVVQQRA